MSSITSVPPIQFTTTGIVVPAESAVLAGVQADMNAAFGGNLNPSLSTPGGQLASSTTAIIGAKNDLFAKYINQIDPATASGTMQDAIGRIYFMDRLPATSTTVQVLCTGLAGVVIPVGALVADSSGNRYACTLGGTIPVGGSITLAFAAVNMGPIVCAIGAITTIYQSIIGWDTASNAAAGVLGTNVESRADFEYRRQQSVALNAAGSLASVYANVFSVPNVTDVYCTQNVTDAPVTIGAVTLAAHSVYVAAAGGDPTAIATAIWKKASLGCNYNGNTSIVVTDTSGYNVPYPTYTIKYQVPAPLPVYVAVTVQNQSAVSNASLSTLIKNAILGAFSGTDGGTRARIGSTIYASRYYSAVGGVAPLAVVSIFVGLAASPTANSVTAGIDAVPTLAAANISVTFV
jgi:hypothetical protein